MIEHGFDTPLGEGSRQTYRHLGLPIRSIDLAQCRERQNDGSLHSGSLELKELAMSWNRTIGIFVACSTVFLSSSLLAQPYRPGDGSGHGWWQGWGMGWTMHPPGRGRHMMIDANDDGLISDEEAASAADGVFTAMDADDDGSLTKEEYMAVRMGPQRGFNLQRQAAMQEQKEARFSEMDADSNGMVSKGEFLDAAQAHHVRADTDGDGNVTPWEFRRQNWN